jgi:hypothetical protein
MRTGHALGYVNSFVVDIALSGNRSEKVHMVVVKNPRMEEMFSSKWSAYDTHSWTPDLLA